VFYKCLKVKSNDWLDTLVKITFLHEQVEKKLSNLMSNDNSVSLSGVKTKLKLLYDTEIKQYGRLVIDYYVITITNKIKLNPTRFDIEVERSRIKLLLKLKTVDSFSYILELLVLSFTQSINSLSRKLFLFVSIILVKILGLSMLKKFMDYLANQLDSSDMVSLISSLDFSLLYENGNYSYINLDSNSGFLKCFEQLITELIGTSGIRFDDKNFEEENATKVNHKFSALVSLINLCESYLRAVRVMQSNGIQFNITSIYNFYSNLQNIVR
jgi:hypothetical protein